MAENLKKVQQRATQYWFSDGLAELSGGLICLLLAVLFWVQQAAPKTPLITAAFFLFAFASAFGIRWLIQRIKERITYPRTGFVEYKSGWEHKGAVAVAIAFTLLLTALMLFLEMKDPEEVVWTPAIGGLIFAFIFTWTGFQIALPRFYFLAAFCLLAGALLAISGLGDLHGAAILSGLTSLVLFAFSGLTRRAYLRRNPLLP